MRTLRSGLAAGLERKLRVWVLAVVFGQAMLTMLVLSAFQLL